MPREQGHIRHYQRFADKYTPFNRSVRLPAVADSGNTTSSIEVANGAWIKRNPIPDDHASWGAFDQVEQRNLAIQKGILEDAARLCNQISHML